jgi:hypothetical protein
MGGGLAGTGGVAGGAGGGAAGTGGLAGAGGSVAGSGGGSFNCAPCPGPLTCRGGGVDDTCGYTQTSPAGKVCSPGGWCFVMPVPQGNTLYSVFTISPTDVWAAGAAATVIHWNGSSWSGTAGLVEAGTGGNAATFYTVWASGPGDIWLAGTTGAAPLLVHGDGTHWNLVSVPTSGTNPMRFQGIWGSGPNDVWIGAYRNGSLYHWDGVGWTRAVYADNGTTYIKSVTGVAKNDLYVVTDDPYLQHFDGSTFTEVSAVAGAEVVWATPAAGLWALADGGQLWHLLGSTWISYKPPGVYSVNAIWGDSPSSLWVAGATGTGGGTLTFWRFNNGTWTVVPLPYEQSVFGISGPTNQSDAIAVGGSGEIDLLTGATAAEDPHNAGATFDVQGTSSSDVWMVGGPNFRATHWDGAGLTDYALGGSGAFTAVGASPGGDVWTATTNASYKFNGTSFGAHTGPPSVTPRMFWAPQNDSLWVTSGTNAVYNWTGSAWQPVASPLAGSSVLFYGVWGASTTNVWLVGSAGITQHYDGTSWTPYTTPDTSAALMGVWGWDATHALTTSSDGVIYSWDGQQWAAAYSLAGGFGRIHGCSQNDIWAVRSDASRIEHFDGVSWSDSGTGLAQPAVAVWCASPGDAWITGTVSSIARSGAVLRRE